jgi:hypothetical protein
MIALAGAWCATVIVLGACAIVLGVDLTIGNAELWLMACLLPPTILLPLWRGSRPTPIPIPMLLRPASRVVKEIRR